MSYHGVLKLGMTVQLKSNSKSGRVVGITVKPDGTVWLHLMSGVIESYVYSKANGWIVVDGKRKLHDQPTSIINAT